MILIMILHFLFVRFTAEKLFWRISMLYLVSNESVFYSPKAKDHVKFCMSNLCCIQKWFTWAILLVQTINKPKCKIGFTVNCLYRVTKTVDSIVFVQNCSKIKVLSEENQQCLRLVYKYVELYYFLNPILELDTPFQKMCVIY